MPDLSIKTVRNVEEKLADFYYHLYQAKVPIRIEGQQLLIERKLINRPNTKKVIPKKYADIEDDEESREEEEKVVSVLTEDEFKKVRTHRVFQYRKDSAIQTEEWMPDKEKKENFEYDNEFVSWIDSINGNFQTRKSYSKFELYKQQAYDWLALNKNFEDYTGLEEKQAEFAREEFKKIKANSLFFLNKYVFFQDSRAASGRSRYKAYDAQEIVAFLLDCNYNPVIGKPRQVFFTTTIAAIAIKRINFNDNYFCKLVAENLIKGKEIFKDKYMYVYYNLPWWMKRNPNNTPDDRLVLSYKSKTDKDRIEGANSRLVVETPYETVINGGSPDLILIDEIGQIPIITSIVNEGRPTISNIDPATKRYVQLRQVCLWGTGGEAQRGGAEFFELYTHAFEQWKNRNFSYNLIPIFFSAWAKAGFSEKLYEREQKNYYNRAKADPIQKVKFHQHFPLNIDDMFLSNKEPIIPIDVINRLIEKIYERGKKPQRGYFEPIFDRSQPMPDGFFIPFKIVGVNFKAVDDEGAFLAPVTMYDEPERGWVNRYYDGIDPINSSSGFSNFASAVWDCTKNKVVCELNHRQPEYRNDYLQAILMGIYFETEKTLVENNVGKELINMYDYMGLGHKLIAQSMLPLHIQLNSGDNVGINKKSSNSPYIIGYCLEMLAFYKDNFDSEELMIQLKRFVPVEKNHNTTAIEQIVVFKTENYKFHKDDLIFAYTYAYMAARIYAERIPKSPEEIQKRAVKWRYIQNASTNWHQVRVPVYNTGGTEHQPETFQ